MDEWLFRTQNDFAGWGYWTDGLAWFLAVFGIFLQGLALVARGIFPGANGNRERRRVLLALLAAVFAVGLDAIVAGIFYRHRPLFGGVEGAFDLLDLQPSASFPSRHSTLGFTIALIMGRRSPWQGLLHWTLTLGMTWARVYGGAHFPSDALGSLLIAGAVSWGLLALRSELEPALDRILRLLGASDRRDSDA